MGIPAYRKVYTQIKKNIREEVYPSGTLLPTESELEEIYSVSRTTIRKAVGLLVSEGYLHVKQGRGTEVLDVSTIQRLNQITSITETLTAKGYNVTTRGMLIDRIEASEHIAEMLRLSSGGYVYRVQRVQCADGVPIAIMTNYVKENAAPELEKYSGIFTSLYSFLEQQYHIVFVGADEWISAVAADFSESQILQLPIGAPLLCSRRVCSNQQGPFEYSVIKLCAEKYEYNIHLSGRG